MCESYVQAYSNPCCSASFISSIIRWYGGSGRTVTPKLSMAPPSRWQGNEHIDAKSLRTVVWAYLLFAFAAGAVLPFQAGVNAQLAARLHSPLWAAFISFLGGTPLLPAGAPGSRKTLPSGGP